MSALLTGVVPQLPACSPDDLLGLLHVLSLLQHQPRSRFMLRFLQHVRGRLQDLGSRQLAGVLHALARLNVRPERRWMETCMLTVRI